MLQAKKNVRTRPYVMGPAKPSADNYSSTLIDPRGSRAVADCRAGNFGAADLLFVATCDYSQNEYDHLPRAESSAFERPRMNCARAMTADRDGPILEFGPGGRKNCDDV